MGKLSKYFSDDIVANVMLSQERNLDKMEATIKVRGMIFRAEDKSEDFFDGIDNVVDKLASQMSRFKGKLQRKHKDYKEFNFQDWPEPEEEEEIKIVRKKRFELEPMTVDEAIIQMEMLEHNFYVFLNMCGIVGYVGNETGAKDIILGGLKSLEYRGYDSAGIALICNGKIEVRKKVGEISNLEKIIGDASFDSNIGIGHTRWATHGVPSDLNAHPHCNSDETLSIVHNGIIENYMEIKEQLVREHGARRGEKTVRCPGRNHRQCKINFLSRRRDRLRFGTRNCGWSHDSGNSLIAEQYYHCGRGDECRRETADPVHQADDKMLDAVEHSRSPEDTGI